MRASEAPTSRPEEEFTALHLLTRREREVARLIALGHTNAEVGDFLKIHQKTVESHRNHLMTKLGLKTRADLVRLALAQGLVQSRQQARFFQFCRRCHVLWSSRSQFLSDGEVHFCGYQSAGPAGAPGAFCFEHRPCGSALLVHLEDLVELAGEPVLAASCARDGSPAQYCLGNGTSQSCPLRCICAFVWRTSQIMTHWPKN
jgi:DNA-binding CsgD family transcriptional regulator